METVLSTDKYFRHIRRARQLGYIVSMIYVAVQTPEIAVERVALRVQAGGHDVPEEKIRARWERSHRRLAEIIPELDALFIFDNTAVPPVLVAQRVNGVGWVVRGRLPTMDELVFPHIV